MNDSQKVSNINSDSNNNSNQEEQQPPKRTPAEWVTFGIASLILLGVMGLVGYSWITKPEEKAIISININNKIRQVNDKFYVPFEVENTGGETAESVQVIAELKFSDKVEETGEQQIDFLSRNEKQSGAFIFSRNPELGKLTLRVGSYKSP
ncbi:MAG: TIGR02588 family protein [Scytonematopsis contorta HA4267-MV1]|jgi:uncharacterized protein (TIGR02588 family)|nr:TIGR02588 family protein [Scytonematopsis contorta HA4267-MV1]